MPIGAVGGALPSTPVVLVLIAAQNLAVRHYWGKPLTVLRQHCLNPDLDGVML
jgi:hypothetical protein